MKIRALAFCVVLICLVCFACRHRQHISEVSVAGLTFQVIKLPLADGEPGGLAYAARLISDKTDLGKKNALAISGHTYQMDSCFYLQSGKNKVFAESVQPIANGLPDRPEYRLGFKEVDNAGNSWSLVYEGRYFNEKKYSLKLSDIR